LSAARLEQLWALRLAFIRFFAFLQATATIFGRCTCLAPL
jgi:hypothetical protein